MKCFLPSLAVLLLASLATAQEATTPPTPMPQVDRDAVLRCGDMVQHIDGTIREGHGDVFIQAISPPASDADKWFVSVIAMKGCQPCAALKQAFANSEHLRAFAKPDDAKASWAHYTVYDKDDTSQQYRWKNIKITGYPTLLIQPPASGKWGPPSTVVAQLSGFEDAKTTADKMANAIRRYVQKFRDAHPKEAAKPKVVATTAGHKQLPIGIDPPFSPADRDIWTPATPSAQPVEIPPHETPTDQLGELWGLVTGFLGGLAWFALKCLGGLLGLACPAAFVAAVVYGAIWGARKLNASRAATIAVVAEPLKQPEPSNTEKLLAEVLARLPKPAEPAA